MAHRTQTIGEGKFIRQHGPPGRYGHVKLTVEPSASTGALITWEVDDQQIPAMFEPAVRRGIEEWLGHSGSGDQLAFQGLIVRVVGGSHHQTDSNETSYVTAAALAMKDAFEKAKLR